MVFAEPLPTKFDLKFTLAGVPVRVHPLFWLVSALMLIGNRTSPLEIAIWLGAVFVSVLVHELGHALAFRRYGFTPRITLYSFGGLASVDPRHGARPPTGQRQILICAAGPAAGFALGAAVLALVVAAGYSTHILGRAVGSGPQLPNEVMWILVHDLVFINLFWGLMNLLPVHPLDGGQIAREIFSARDPAGGLRRSLGLSVISGIAVAIAGIAFLHSMWTAVLFGYLAYMSYLVLRRQHGAPSLGVRARSLESRWRAWREDQARKKWSRRMKSIDQRTARQIRATDAGEGQPIRPDLEREANEVLREVAEEAKRMRAAEERKP